MFSSFYLCNSFRLSLCFSYFCVISKVIFNFCCPLCLSAHFSCCVFVSIAYVSLFALCQAGDRLLQLERKIQALEQEKSLETTEGTLTSLRR